MNFHKSEQQQRSNNNKQNTDFNEILRLTCKQFFVCSLFTINIKMPYIFIARKITHAILKKQQKF